MGTHLIVLFIAGRSFQVASGDPERSRVETNIELLRTLASPHGTFTPAGGDLSGLVDAIPDRSIHVRDDIQEPLWDTRLMLIAFVFLIIVEWTIRKLHGLA